MNATRGGLEGIATSSPEGSSVGTSGAYEGTAELGGSARVKLFQLRRRGARFRFEARRVAAGEASARLVGALAEREQRRPRIASAAHGLVGKNRQGAGAVLDPAA